MTLLGAGSIAACVRSKRSKFVGSTMGTTYSVILPSSMHSSQIISLQLEVEDALNSVVMTMSNFDRYSELSEFNASNSTQWQPLSSELFTVFDGASQVARFSAGAYDATIWPLVELWGFGPGFQNASMPKTKNLARTRTNVGQHLLQLDLKAKRVRKRLAEVQVDLSSIGKGFGADRIAALLESRGIGNYLVEIGGDFRVGGASAAQRPWRLAIEAPQSSDRRIATMIEIRNGGVATSGNYRNYFAYNGRLYPHVLNPGSGEPINHPPMSVTVVSETAMKADALATALLVMGPDAGYRFASKNGLAALFLGWTESESGKQLHIKSTAAMPDFLAA